MSMLSYLDLVELVESGVITGLEASDQINASSIDVRLGDVLLTEPFRHEPGIVDPHLRTTFKGVPHDLSKDGPYLLPPGGFVLASTVEVFHLPLDLTGEFRMKSSGARSGLNHLMASHADPGWHGSVLTLELHNVLRHHHIRLTRGMRIGQVLFHRHARPVPLDRSYAARGRYNNDRQVSGVKP
jgi:dCTP deaminase